MTHKDGGAVEACARVEIDAELRRFADEDGLGAANAHRHARKVACGVHHAGEPHAGEKERKREAKRERVVDGTDEQDDEREHEEPAKLRRHDVDPPVYEDDDSVLRRRETVEPVGEARPALEKGVDHAGIFILWDRRISSDRAMPRGRDSDIPVGRASRCSGRARESSRPSRGRGNSAGSRSRRPGWYAGERDYGWAGR